MIVELIISITIGIIFLLILILLSKYPIVEWLIETDVKKTIEMKSQCNEETTK